MTVSSIDMPTSSSPEPSTSSIAIYAIVGGIPFLFLAVSAVIIAVVWFIVYKKKYGHRKSKMTTTNLELKSGLNNIS